MVALPLSTSQFRSFPFFSNSPCPALTHRITRDLLFSQDVNHVTDVPVCTRELTRARRKEKKGLQKRMGRDRNWSNRRKSGAKSARDRDRETGTICISHRRNNRSLLNVPSLNQSSLEIALVVFQQAAISRNEVSTPCRLNDKQRSENRYNVTIVKTNSIGE